MSPFLANVALSIIEEQYERHTWPRAAKPNEGKRGRPAKALIDPVAIARRAFMNRANDRRAGRCVFVPVRYADDFIILVGSPEGDPEEARQIAEQEKSRLAAVLSSQMGLTLSPEKTLVTPVTRTMRFLGHHLRVRQHPRKRTLVPRLVIPKDRSQRLRRTIKQLFDRSTVTETLEQQLQRLNPVLRGWGHFYRHAWGAKRVFASLDHYVWWTILRWLRKKHPTSRMRDLAKQYGWHQARRRSLCWRDGNVVRTMLSALRVVPYRMGQERGPRYA